MRNWTFLYHDNVINVAAKAGKAKLTINGIEQATSEDYKKDPNLYGTLKDGEEIHTVIGGPIYTRCSLYVDKLLQELKDA